LIIEVWKVGLSTSSSAGTSTIRFINDASNNTVQYCTIKGSSTATTNGGIILLHTGISTGNDNNIIDNNNLTCTTDYNRPVSVIFSSGSSASIANNNIIVSNNNIYNFFNRGLQSYGVNFSTNTSDCTVSGNSFYETARFIPTLTVGYYPIRINNSGTNFTVTGNFIGGQSANCGGSAWNKTSAANSGFYGIYLNVGTTTRSNVQGNTIKNISWSNSTFAGFYGICIDAGAANIGTQTENIIGSDTGTGSIFYQNSSGGAFYGIYTSGNAITTIENNKIGSITSASTNPANPSSAYGIYISSGTPTIKGNIIGSTTTTNSIQATSVSTSNPQYVYGIYSNSTTSTNIQNNIIANLTNGTTNTNNSTAGLINGIYCNAGTNTIINNTIRDLTIANANNSTTHTASVTGIAFSSNAYLNAINNNAIYNLSNTNSDFAGQISGIYFTGAVFSFNQISKNFIHSLTATGINSSASIYGVKVISGVTQLVNNIISLGGNSKSTIYGLYDTGAAGQTCKAYFNTINVYGSLATGSVNKSYCLYSAASNNKRDYRNNIFQNSRSTTDGSNLHYAISLTSNDNLTCDYNDYYVAGIGGVLGNLSENIITTLADWKTATAQDEYSINISADFANANGTTTTDYIPLATNINGIFINDVLYDFNNTFRLSASRMGAFEVENSDPKVELWSNGTYFNSYNNLKETFDAINSGLVTGSLVIKITENIEETTSAILNASGNGGANYNNLVIYPTKDAISVCGNIDMPLIDLNGADNVTIDGRRNGEGSAKNLLLINVSTASTAGNSTLRFINDATNNTVKFCTLRGASTATTGGIVLFHTGEISGNDNNSIEFNDITCANDVDRPVNAIYSIGTSESIANNNININGNNIFNFFNRSLNSFGINLNEYNSDCTVSDNSFYETDKFVPTGNGALTFIYINSITGNNFSVNNNYLGGQLPNCGGNAWTKSTEGQNTFNGILLNVGSLSESNIQGNTIKNFSWADGNGTSNVTVINITEGLVNIGTETGNVIGSDEGTNSINLLAAVQGYFCGINIVNATAICSNNKIGSITTSSTAGYGYYMYGIYKTSHIKTFSAFNNTIGSKTTANSFDATSRAYNTQFRAWQHQIVYGIFSDMINGGKTYIENNTIANINNRAETPGKMGTKIIGIGSAGGSCENNIINNSIHDLTVANNVEYKDANGSLTGIAIFQYSLNTRIIGNKIYNLINTNPSFLGLVCGISINGNTICSNNFIHSISLNVISATNADVVGIRNSSGKATISNNIISIGGNYRATINGIYDATAYAFDETKLYFNTIYINGTLTIYDYYMSSCLYSHSNVGKRDYRNNIFYNARSKTTAGNNQHTAYFNYGTAGNLTLDYNDYYVSGTGGAPFNMSIFAGQNANSINQDPLFTNRGGLSAEDYQLSDIKIFGVSETGITDDYGYVTRSNCPTMGAWELVPENLWTGNRNDNWGDCHNWTFDVPGPGDNVTFYVEPKNHAVLDINRVIGSLNNAQSTYRPVLDGKTLTMNGALNFTNGAQMDASATGSTLVLSGSVTPQVIGENFLYEDKMYNLVVSNPDDAVLHGRMILLNSLSATSGVLDASTNNPTVVLGGTNPQTFGGNELLNGDVYNLTIDNEANAKVSSNLTVQNNLTLTKGNISTDDLTLTLEGNTVGSGGYISTNPSAGTIEYAGASAQTIRRIKDNTANALLVTNTSSEGATMIGTDDSFGDLNTFNLVNVVNGSRLNIAPGEKLTVNNDLLNNGTFVLQSDNQGTATLLTPGTLSTDAGTYKVEQYLTGANNGSAPNGRFWYVSTPVSGATSATFNPVSGLNKLWSWYEPTHSYIQIADNNTSLVNGKGYVARMGNTGNVEFSSKIMNNGDITLTGLSWTGNDHLNRGYNLVGNPYPSYLNWKDVWVDPNTGDLRENGLPNRMRATMWVRSENSSLYTYNAVAGAYVTTNPQKGEISDNNIQYIAPMQAFWVETFDPEMTDGSITFTNSMRSHQISSHQRLRAKSANQNEKQTVKLQITDGTNSDETVVLFNAKASDTYDLYDSRKMSQTTLPQLYTKAGSNVLSINTLSAFNNERVVPLGFSVPASGSYSISANEIANFAQGTQVLLLDNTSGNVTELTDGIEYHFTSAKTDSYNRFSLIFRSPGLTTDMDSFTNGNITVFKNGDNKITVICKEDVMFNASVTVYNVTGQVLANKALSGVTTVVDNQFIPGVYIVKVNNGANAVSTKVVIE
jgi:hypothetical protein